MSANPLLRTRRPSLLLFILAGLTLPAMPLHAAEYEAMLDGVQPVPPSGSATTGSATLTLDGSNVLHYNITYGTLQGTEIAAHFHGPGAVGVDADVITFLPSGSPKNGTYGPLAPFEIAELDAELWYINIHSTTFNNGEIRGQIVPKPNVDVGPRTIPARLAIERIRPNPSRGSSVIVLGLPLPGNARLRVFDVRGRLVRTLLNESVNAGLKALAWDGRDERGTQLGEGIYFLQLESETRSATGRMVIVR